MTKVEFAHLFIKALEYRYVDYVFKLNDDLSINAIPESRGKGHTLFVDNAYNSYIQNSLHVKPEDVINSYVEAIYESFYDIKKGNLDYSLVVPIIKPVEYLKEVTRVSGSDGDPIKLAYTQYNEKLVVLYAEDNTQSIRFLSEQDVIKSGETIENLHKKSIENFERKFLTLLKVAESQGTYFVRLDENKESSLILLEELWSEEYFTVNGEIVIGIPCRHLIIVTGSKETTVIDRLKELVQALYMTDPYPISNRLFILKKGKFIDFK